MLVISCLNLRSNKYLIILRNMARAIFEYTKTVLKKVSFDVELFCKELEKGIRRLLPFEIEELRIWLMHFTADRPELNVCMAVIK
jgi:DNA replication protein DnaD